MKRTREGEEPETRVGICWGCQSDTMALFKVPNISRYRCADCFERETGDRHHLSPPREKPLVILP